MGVPYRYIESVFSRFDENADGVLSLAEFEKLVRFIVDEHGQQKRVEQHKLHISAMYEEAVQVCSPGSFRMRMRFNLMLTHWGGGALGHSIGGGSDLASCLCGTTWIHATVRTVHVGSVGQCVY